MAQYMHMILQGAVYSANRRYEHFSITLKELCKCLHGVTRGYPAWVSPHLSARSAEKVVELSFNAIYQQMPCFWQLQYDIPDPFGDSREKLVSAVIVIDLDNDVMVLRTKYQSRRALLKRFRREIVTFFDMERFQLPPLAEYVPSDYSPAQTWKPETSVSEQQVAFVGKVLNDFSHQWRHVFRSRYNNSTFLRLAWALVRIASLDFTVKEVAPSRAGPPGPPVWVDELPKWGPAPGIIIDVNGVPVVLCQHMAHSIATIRVDLSRRAVAAWPAGDRTRILPCTHITYLVLSIRHVFLYKVCIGGGHNDKMSAPEQLFTGVGIPSKRGLEYLMILAPNGAKPCRLNKLPVEIQDLILSRVSRGPVESARVGCTLSIGSAFKWENERRRVERQEEIIAQTCEYPVDSQIMFDSVPSGLAYEEFMQVAAPPDRVRRRTK